MSMKALVFHGKGDIRVQDVPIPKCGDGQVKVKPVWCGICGTDLHEFLGGPNICPTSPHPITGESVPVTFGHEFAGVVEEIGKGVTKVKVGDKVSVEPIIWCGKCTPCNENVHNCCDKYGFVGLSGWGGGLSEACVVPEASLYPIPDNVSLEEGALVEPLAVGWHAVKVSPLQKGDAALVLGGGPIGLAVIQALKAQGAGLVIVSEMAEKRKEFAKLFGADHIVDPTSKDMVAEVRKLAGGDGVACAYDCAGVQAGLDQAFDCLKVRGTIVNIAVWEKNAQIFPTKLLFQEAKYMCIATYARGDFTEVLDAISKGLIDPKRMITKKIRLNEIVEQGFDALINDKANQVKILVDSSPV